MSSRSSRTRRRRGGARLARRCPQPAVAIALDAAPSRFEVKAYFSVAPDLCIEDVAHLYWAVQALDPVTCDLDDDELTARFTCHGPSLDVAAWGLIDQVRALPHARLVRVEARAGSALETELLVTGDKTTNSLRRTAG
jgi:hypothetical protein